MQAVCQVNVRPDAVLLFARRHGRDYMMRSEKRTGYSSGSSSGGQRPPRRRRRRAGFFYILLSLLLSVLLWPIGMIMLWRRKVRWRVTTKLLASIITLVLFVTLYGFGLTVQTDNPTVTMVQDRVNDFIDDSAVFIADGYQIICDKSVEIWDAASDLADGAGRAALTVLADGIDRGVELGGDVRQTVSGMLESKDEPAEPEPTAEASVEPVDEPSATPSEEPVAAPSEEPTIAPTEEPAMTPAVAPSSEPSAETSEEPAVSESPEPVMTDEPSDSDDAPALTAPEATPDPGTAKAIGNGTLSRSREFTEASPTPTVEPTAAPTETPEPSEAPVEATAEPEATEAPVEATAEPEATEAPVEPTAEAEMTPSPTETPEPTAEPTPAPELTPKPAGEAVVYFNANGVNYHMRSTCKNMSHAPAGTLSDAVENGLRRCKNCGTPDASILEAENVVWVDEAGRFHLTDECGDFTGAWSLMTLTDALADGILPCSTCQADLYMTSRGLAVPTPSPEPTPTPEPVVVTPEKVLKPAGEALVYHSSNGGWYHTEPNCSGMGGAKLYPLSECVGRYKRCRKCEAPLPELVNEHCLWMDMNGECHTTDECPAFAEGKYTLIPRDEALSAGHTGCTVCGADEYLMENTIIDYPGE